MRARNTSFVHNGYEPSCFYFTKEKKKLEGWFSRSSCAKAGWIVGCQATARRFSVESRRLRFTLTIFETPGSCMVTP